MKGRKMYQERILKQAQVDIPKGHCSELFLFRKVFILKVDTPNCHCSLSERLVF